MENAIDVLFWLNIMQVVMLMALLILEGER